MMGRFSDCRGGGGRMTEQPTTTLRILMAEKIFEFQFITINRTALSPPPSSLSSLLININIAPLVECRKW